MKKLPPLPPDAPKHHRQMGEKPRVRIANGPTVDATTAETFEAWHKAGASYGVIIDRLTILAIESGYDPVTQTYKKQTKSQKPGLVKQISPTPAG